MTGDDRLDRFLAAVLDGAERGLTLGAEHLLAKANETVPIEEGTLGRSGRATVDAASLEAAVSYSTPYAVKQHEDLSLRHDDGRTAKWLEVAANAEADTIGRILEGQIDEAVRTVL